ncbi:MAG: YqjK-like family protein [Pseudomonadota bacterium]
MNSKLTELAERRKRLVAQAAAQRTALAQNAAPWRARLALADRGVEALRTIRRHPAWLLGATLLLVALRPGRAGRWTRFAWVGWQVGRKLLGR